MNRRIATGRQANLYAKATQPIELGLKNVGLNVAKGHGSFFTVLLRANSGSLFAHSFRTSSGQAYSIEFIATIAIIFLAHSRLFVSVSSPPLSIPISRQLSEHSHVVSEITMQVDILCYVKYSYIKK